MSHLTGEIAADGTTCGVCALAVGGWPVGVTHDGKRTWDRPSYTSTTPTGAPYTGGGFTHVEGGERCVPSVLVVVAEPETPAPADRVVEVAAARAKLAMEGATT